MLNFRLNASIAAPVGRRPRINRQHPLFNQQHMVHMGVASGGQDGHPGTTTSPQGSWIDLLSGAVATNTTTLGGQDSNGAYIWSGDNAGTATTSMTVVGTAFNFITWGCIFQFRNSQRQSTFSCGPSTNGINTINAAINFQSNGGTKATWNGQTGHTYFALATNVVATASQNATFILYDLTTGQVYTTTTASSGNIVVTPVQTLIVATSTICTNRLYCGFITGSVLVPPAVTPPATFYSVDQLWAGVRDPWGLWYA